MNRFVKWALATVAVVVILVFGAAILLPRFVDPNGYKSYISDVVFNETGKELFIAGNIEWQMFPVPGLSVSDMALTEPGESVESALVSIGDRIRVAQRPITAHRRDFQRPCRRPGITEGRHPRCRTRIDVVV